MNRTRERILTVQKILLEETSKDNPISTIELIQCLEMKGIPAERKSLYKDMMVLKEFHDIRFRSPGRKGGKGWYFHGDAEKENHNSLGAGT